MVSCLPTGLHAHVLLAVRNTTNMLKKIHLKFMLFPWHVHVPHHKVLNMYSNIWIELNKFRFSCSNPLRRKIVTVCPLLFCAHFVFFCYSTYTFQLWIWNYKMRWLHIMQQQKKIGWNFPSLRCFMSRTAWLLRSTRDLLKPAT